MEITTTDEKFVMTVDRTPDDLQKAIRFLVEENAKLRNNLAGDTKEPLTGGDGRADVRVIDGIIQIGLGSYLGWLLTRFDSAGACRLAASIIGAAGQLLATTQAQTEVAVGKVSLH